MEYVIEDIICPDCAGYGDIFTQNQVPWLDTDRPCGRCLGLGKVERIRYVVEKAPETASKGSQSASQGERVSQGG